MILRFPIDTTSGRVGLEMYPTAAAAKLQARRTSLNGEPFIDAIPGAENSPASLIDPLAQVKMVGDPYPGAFAQGHTMLGSPSVDAFSFSDQKIEEQSRETIITTTLQSKRQLRIEHRISWHHDDDAISVTTTFYNDAREPVTLEMLASFCLGGITPFHVSDAPGRLKVHRFRSGWSAEGRLESRSIEQLHLERSWSGAGIFSERFGQVGSMPVRRWFPFVAVEDTEAGVIWGAQLAWAGSWQMEIFRQHDSVSISGGLADREFGHWMKTLAPGESLETPTAVLACVEGNLDQLCDRLTRTQRRAADLQPEVERDLPIVFNEWCTTWGDPSHEKIAGLAKSLKGSAAKYLVIDAGWYKSAGTDWNSGHGDWIPSPQLFPKGLAAAAATIREAGFIPGLWFEMETVGSSSIAFSLVDHLLQRDGQAVTVRQRRFWDMTDPFVIDYLTTHVIDLLESCGFGYLKIDYNETAGLGATNGGAESLGEGLRLHILGVYRFFDKIRERLPNLVIENCSSGGHRLEPSMLARTAMSSFSDAHELPEIPIIAANLHRLILPRQNQVWAVLHASDSDRRLVYSLAATFLGRMCLSGDIDRLSDAQLKIVHHAERLYGKAAPVIKDGVSRHFGQVGESWRHPEGWQAIVRIHDDGKSALVVLHAFAKSPAKMEIPLPGETGWHLTFMMTTEGTASSVHGQTLRHTSSGDFSAAVFLLTR